MFAKIFCQIFDSSIAEDFTVRHMFMDLLVLADKDGVVDMTPKAISGRTGVPLDQVLRTIESLSSPDPESRSKEHEGRRLIAVDEKRSWGWKIVNYEHYREIRDEESRRAYFRTYRALKRAEQKNATPVHTCSPQITQAEGEADSDREEEASNKRVRPHPGTTFNLKFLPIPPALDCEEFRGEWVKWIGYRMKGKKLMAPEATFLAQLEFLARTPKDAIAILKASVRNGWTGLFPLAAPGRAPGPKVDIDELKLQVKEARAAIKANQDNGAYVYPEMEERLAKAEERLRGAI